MKDDEIRDLFQQMRDEPPPPDSLVRVREAVFERTAGAPGRRWFALGWKIGAALVLAALVLMVTFIKPALRPDDRAEIPEKALLPSEVDPIVTPPALRQVQRAEIPKPARHVARKITPPEPKAVAGTTIRIETPDPDVVILLVGDDTGS